MSPKSAIRRLLKSRLRLHLLNALMAQRPADTWAAVVEVEQGIAEDAWRAWCAERETHSTRAIREAVTSALVEAATSVAQTFTEVSDGPWLAEQIDVFVKEFRASDLEAD